MATSSARMMVRVSSHPAASIYIVLFVGMCITAAPSMGCPLMSEPLVYTHSSGEKWGVQGTRTGRVVHCGYGGDRVSIPPPRECSCLF
jgi:hypothetical protein